MKWMLNDEKGVVHLRLFKKAKKPKIFKNDDGRPKLYVDSEQIMELKQQGKSNREIARIFGCSEGTIRNRLSEDKSAQ